mgnify:CR=1 FL=1
MMRVKVMVKNNQKTIKVPVGIRMLIRRCCQAVLVMEQFPHDAEVSVSFVSNAEIRNLNRIYRKKDSVTDVLSFPMFELTPGKLPASWESYKDPDTGLVPLGDMAISLERAKQQAAEFGHSARREVGYLTIHSILHLLGYDHLDEGPMKAQMRAAEEAILAEIELPR